jgi:hypothetical protein
MTPAGAFKRESYYRLQLRRFRGNFERFGGRLNMAIAVGTWESRNARRGFLDTMQGL